MLQVEDTAPWTSISGSRLKVSRSLLHPKKHPLTSKGSLTLTMKTNLQKGDTTQSSSLEEKSWKQNLLQAKEVHPKAYPWPSLWARTACDLMTALFQ